MSAGRTRGALDASARGPGELVQPAGPQSRARMAQEIWWTRGASGTAPSRLWDLVDPAVPQNRARVAKDIGSNSRALEPERESPGTAFRPLGPSDRSASRQGELVDTTAPSKVQSLPGCLLKPWALGHGPDSPERQVNPADPPTRSQVSLEVGRHRRHSDPGPSLPGLLVKSAGTRTQDRVACDSWSTTRALGPKDESPGTSGRPCLP